MVLYFLYRLAFLTTFMTIFTELKYNIKKSCIILSVTMSVIWLANSVIYKFTNIDFSNSIYPFTVSIPAFLCFIFISESNKSKVLFSFLSVCNFGMLTSFMGLLTFFITGSFAIRFFTELACIILIMLLSLKVFRKPYFRMLSILDNGWGFLCSIPGLLSVIIYLLLYYPTEFYSRPGSIPIIILVFSLMFAIYILFYINFQNVAHYYQLKQDKNFMLLQTDLQKREYAAIMDKIDAIKIYRHDMRHHINAINAFLQDDNMDQARKYLSNLDRNLNETIIEKYCDNYCVNVILSSYIKKAKNEHIEVLSEVDIPEKTNIDNMELGSIFSNAIENAINACIKIGNPMERKISVICREHYGQIYIQISNTFAGEITFNGGYPVSDKKGHGFGTRSMAAIAEKHGGVFSFTAEGGIFRATVILNH